MFTYSLIVTMAVSGLQSIDRLQTTPRQVVLHSQTLKWITGCNDPFKDIKFTTESRDLDGITGNRHAQPQKWLYPLP